MGSREVRPTGTVTDDEDAFAAPPAITLPDVPIVDAANYELGAEIARGGMGRIVAARDKRLGRPVAIKILLADKPVLAARFAREARITARLQHPSIIPIHETGRIPTGEPCYVMKLVEGRSLGVEIDARPTLRERMALLPNVIAVADALGYAHSERVIHRDLKPANVVIGAFGETIVIDWGLARDLRRSDTDDAGASIDTAEGLTVAGGVVGTPAFMPPEQARGEEVDARADVYALGALLYHVLAGSAPYRGSGVDVIESVLAGPPTPIAEHAPEVPQDLLAIIDKAMQRDRDARYATAKELAEDLRRFQAGQMVSARSYSLRTRVARFVRRNRLAVAGVAAALVAAAIPFAMWRKVRGDAEEVADAAQQFGQQVERIERGLERAYLMPLHDVRPERADVQRQMMLIDADMRERGGGAELVGHAALGRGYLALGDYAHARDELAAAIAGGYRPPDTSYAYGRTLGKLYERARADLQRVKDPTQRAMRLAVAQISLRDPALVYLHAGGARGVYGAALLALYEGRRDDAIEGARRAFAESPALYEAKKLEADALADRAQEELDTGAYDKAVADSERAHAAYVAAIEIARSDPAPRRADCTRWRQLLNMQGWSDTQSERPHEMFERAIASCRDAAAADPSSSEVAQELCAIYGIHGEWKMNHGEDPDAALAEAIRFGKRAVELEPTRGANYSSLGYAQLQIATRQAGVGDNPVASLRAAISILERGVAIEPTTNMYNLLGAAWQDVGHYEADPEPSIARSLDSYRKALELGPTNAPVYNNIVTIHQRRAELALARGADPAAHVAAAVESARHALAINPKYAYGAEALGSSHWYTGRYDIMLHRDPSAAFARALDGMAMALRFDPGFATAHIDSAGVLVDHAQYVLDTGGDPAPLLARARTELVQARELDANDSEAPRWLGELERVTGEHALRRGASPEQAFAAAARALDDSEALNKSAAELFQSRARLAVARARWRPVQSEIDAGIRAADRAVAIDSFRTEPLRLRAELLRLAKQPP